MTVELNCEVDVWKSSGDGESASGTVGDDVEMVSDKMGDW